MRKEPEQLKDLNSDKKVQSGDLVFRNLLENPICFDTQQHELGHVILGELNKQLKSLKDEMIDIEELSLEEQKTLVSHMVLLYQFQINYFSSEQDHSAIHEAITDYHIWKRTIIQSGKLGNYFDIFTVSQEDIEKMRNVLDQLLVQDLPQKERQLSIAAMEQVPVGRVKLLVSVIAAIESWGGSVRAKLSLPDIGKYTIGEHSGLAMSLPFFGHLRFEGLFSKHKKIVRDRPLWKKKK